MLTTASDTAVAPEFLASLQRVIEFALGAAAYDSEKVQQTAEQPRIIFIPLINRRNSEERKDAYVRVLPSFLKTRFS